MRRIKFKFKEFKEIGFDLYDIFKTNTFLLFVFSNKPSVEFIIDSRTNKDIFIETMCGLLRGFGKHGKHGDLNCSWIDYNTGNRALVSKSKKLQKKMVRCVCTDADYDLNVGRYYGIPECCIQKYIEDNNRDSSKESFLRYKRQLIDLKIKRDVYDIGWKDNGTLCDGIGFIPCHPHCKKAGKILDNLKRIKKGLGMK